MGGVQQLLASGLARKLKYRLNCWSIFGRFPAKVGPRIPPDGSGSKKGAKRPQKTNRDQFECYFVTCPAPPSKLKSKIRASPRLTVAIRSWRCAAATENLETCIGAHRTLSESPVPGPNSSPSPMAGNDVPRPSRTIVSYTKKTCRDITCEYLFGRHVRINHRYHLITLSQIFCF